MRWKGRRGSTHVEDRRSASPKMAVGGGGIIVILVLAGIVWLLGGNPMSLLSQAGDMGAITGGSGGGSGPVEASPQEQELMEFVSVVLADTEEVWRLLLPDMGQIEYREPDLVVFRDRVRSACGFADAQSGPFYCPADQKVYIDLSFYNELGERFGAPGDFAQAYVLAHEVGHHVQNLLGITDQVHGQNGRISEAEYNNLSVRLELQADFLAGVWAHHAHQKFNILERGDIEEALRAAAAIGDDRLQRQAQGHVVPDSFTHGTSRQRAYWFKRGLETGDLAYGDTFRARNLDGE